MQAQTPVRTAIAGLNHGHVTWILRDWQRPDLDVVGFGSLIRLWPNVTPPNTTSPWRWFIAI